jgi:hypothetical protein
MSAVKVETRLRHIVRDMDPLADSLKRFSPSCSRVISIPLRDWKLVRDAGDIARAHGFDIHDDIVEYKGFRVRPIAPPSIKRGDG